MGNRDVSKFLQRLRELLLGREHTPGLRFTGAPRANKHPTPVIPNGPNSKLSVNPYYKRNALAEVKPPTSIYNKIEAVKDITAGSDNMLSKMSAVEVRKTSLSSIAGSSKKQREAIALEVIEFTKKLTAPHIEDAVDPPADCGSDKISTKIASLEATKVEKEEAKTALHNIDSERICRACIEKEKKETALADTQPEVTTDTTDTVNRSNFQKMCGMEKVEAVVLRNTEPELTTPLSEDAVDQPDSGKIYCACKEEVTKLVDAEPTKEPTSSHIEETVDQINSGKNDCTSKEEVAELVDAESTKEPTSSHIEETVDQPDSGKNDCTSKEEVAKLMDAESTKEPTSSHIEETVDQPDSGKNDCIYKEEATKLVNAEPTEEAVDQSDCGKTECIGKETTKLVDAEPTEEPTSSHIEETVDLSDCGKIDCIGKETTKLVDAEPTEDPTSSNIEEAKESFTHKVAKDEEIDLPNLDSTEKSCAEKEETLAAVEPTNDSTISDIEDKTDPTIKRCPKCKKCLARNLPKQD